MVKLHGTKSANRRIAVRAISFVLAAVLVFSAASVFFFDVSAAEITKKEKTYDIAVAFDNSGSMYTTNGNKNNTRWCQAKYAMEIFASMLDYKKGDRLTIYTMWPVTIGANGSDSGTTVVNISSYDDIDKIRNMYTVYTHSKETPYAPIKEGAEALSRSTLDEKWLVVLTDGVFNREGRDLEDPIAKDDNYTKKEHFDLQARLKTIADSGINVQFLGLALSGVPENQKVKESGNLYVSNASENNKASNNLKSEIINVCNRIFKRHLLEKGLDGHKLTLDMSMSKIIVFVQGETNKAPVLKDMSGNVIKSEPGAGLRSYSTVKAQSYDNAKVDTSLHGQVVVYKDLMIGNYTLDYSGSQKNVQIFYEPDVDIHKDVFHIDKETGEKTRVTPDSENLYPGTYAVEYAIVDRQTGENVEKTGLVKVENLNCTAVIENEKTGEKHEEKITPQKNTVELKDGDTMFLDINGTYLGEFTITTRDDAGRFTFKIIPFPDVPELDVEVEVEQSGKWYNTKKRDSWKPVKVYAEIDGEKLTDDQMSRVAPTFTFSPDIPYFYEIVPGESAFAVYIGKDEQGNDAETPPETGDYEVTASLVYTDEHGQVGMPEDDDEKFEIRGYSKVWEFLFWIILIGAIIALIVAWLEHKVYPKSMKLCDDEGNEFNVKRSGKSVTLSSSQWSNDIIGTAKPITKWKNRKRPTLCLTGISFGGDVESANIDGAMFTKNKHTGEWLLDGDDVDLGRLKSPIRLKTGAAIQWTNRETVPSYELLVK